MSSTELNGTMATSAATKANGISTMQTTFALNGSTSESPASTPLAGPSLPFLSPSTEEILKRVTARSASLGAGSAGWEAAREHVLKNMRTSDSISATPLQISSTAGRGRGKGRGRGRGRGSGSGLKIDRNASPATTSTSTTELGPAGKGSVRARNGGRVKSRGRGGRRVGKRKRGAYEEESRSEEDASNDSDSYTPAQTTRSGRAIAKPATYVPTIQSSPQASTKRRKVAARAPSARSVCKTCHRGHSPNANMIVFCDNCNTGYHQYCHHPPIEKDVVLIPDKEWICAACIREKKAVASLHEAREPVDSNMAHTHVDLNHLVPGDQWTATQKTGYFESLSHETLKEILTHIAKTIPDIALFPSIHPSSDTQARMFLTTGHHDENGADSERADSERADSRSEPALEDFIDDDPPANYPKPGLGLAKHLPPESEHLQWLVDDNVHVFSHSFPAKDFKPISDNASTARVVLQVDQQQDHVPVKKFDDGNLNPLGENGTGMSETELTLELKDDALSMVKAQTVAQDNNQGTLVARATAESATGFSTASGVEFEDEVSLNAANNNSIHSSGLSQGS